MSIKIMENRILYEDEYGEIIGEATFKEIDNGLYNIMHVSVEKNRGRGIAAEIVGAAVEEIHKRGGVPISSCSYGAKWLSEHCD